MSSHANAASEPCIQGIPLAEETGIGPLTLGEYLRDICNRYAPNEAVVLREGETAERWTYAELWDRSVAVARALIACGVGHGTRVGVLMTNRPEFLSAFFGTALAGGVPTPVSTFFTASELDEVLRLSNCAVLLFERQVLKKDFAEMLIGLEPGLGSREPGTLGSLRYPYLRHVAALGDVGEVRGIDDWQAFLNRGAGIDPAQVDAASRAVCPSDPGGLFFSSGSTGKAKGILSAHRGICLQMWRWPQWYQLEEPPRTWSSNGFFFSGSFGQTLGGTLSSGGTLILQRWFDGEAALDLMERERATMLLAWPHQWAQLQAAPGYLAADLSAMKYLDAASPVAQHPSISTTWREPFHAYGCTETFTLISVYPANTPDAVSSGSHGPPTAGSTIKIVDPLTGQTQVFGERGEIAVKGPTLMLGYLGIPLDETLDSEGFYHTGDGGWIDETGRLFWEGRLNDIIKTGGANVSPLEIDKIIRELPGVKICQTVGVPDALLGELVVSCVIAHDGFALTETEVQSGAKARLASYKVPRKVLFFTEHDFQTTGSAKIKTNELRALAQERMQNGPALPRIDQTSFTTLR